MNKAIFIDRDGTLNKLIISDEDGYVDGPSKAKQFILLNGAKEFVKSAQTKGYEIIVISNQPRIKSGTVKIEDLNEITEVMCKELGLKRNQVYYCFHKSEDNCECRKPKGGMIKQAAKDFSIDISKSLIMGDSWRDVLAGRDAGVKNTILLGDKNRVELINLLAEKKAMPDFFAKDLTEAKMLLDKFEGA